MHSSEIDVKKNTVYKEENMCRFWNKVVIAGAEECWLWTASKSRGGYGEFFLDKKMVRANRFSWFLTNGKIPEGMHVCHTCDVPSCVNPNHLFLGTNADNMQDKMAKGRFNNGQANKIYCPQKHPYNETNTYIYKNNRQCKMCRNQRARESRATMKELVCQLNITTN